MKIADYLWITDTHTYHKIDIGHILCGELDEFAQQRNAFAQAGRQHDFGHNPVLDLVEAPNEYVQIGGDLAEMMAPKGLVQQLVLVHRPEQVAIEQGDVVGQLLGAERLNVHVDAVGGALLFGQRRLRIK